MVDLAEIYMAADRQQEGEYLYRKAAEMGSVDAIKALARRDRNKEDPLFFLAAMHQEEAPSDAALTERHKKEMGWALLAAEAGDAFSMYQVALAYRFGYPCEKDAIQAYMWAVRGAEQGRSECNYLLGILYENGLGVAKDVRRAFEYYLASANLGHVGAQYDVGRCYEKGVGIPKDTKKAIEFYKKAADQGNTNAADALKRLQAQAAPVQTTASRQTAQKQPEPKQTAPKRACPEHLLKELDEMVGLDTVRNSLPRLLDQTPRYLLFTGNPGTGKAMAARFVGRMYRELGLLSTDKLVDVSIAEISLEKVKSARGGILFIRDADKLGTNVLNSLLPQNTQDILVIAACSPGTESRVASGASRFRETIHFPDYTQQELLDIFRLLSQPYSQSIPPEVYAMAEAQICAAERAKRRNFRNAHEVADILEHLLLLRGSRQDYYRFLSQIHEW